MHNKCWNDEPEEAHLTCGVAEDRCDASLPRSAGRMSRPNFRAIPLIGLIENISHQRLTFGRSRVSLGLDNPIKQLAGILIMSPPWLARRRNPLEPIIHQRSQVDPQRP